MTKTKNKIIFLLTGLIIGVLCTACFYEIKDFTFDFLPTYKYTHSSKELKENLEAVGVMLPEKAYDIDYYYSNSRDYKCWIAFSASDEEIKETIRTLEDKKADKTPACSPKDHDGKKLVNWWPEASDGFEVFYGVYCWMGYDRKNSRLYIYKYSM